MRVYFATSNFHKYEEASRVLRAYGIELIFHRFDKPEMQLSTLQEIALLSALVAYARVGAPVVVEDSGLFVKALGGFPGPFSSYVFKTIGIGGLLKLMENITDREAYFESAVALVYPPYEKVFTARVKGKIAESPRGSGGFGFDPIFIPEEGSRTFAEMSVDEKNIYSHRAKAFRMLGEWLSGLRETFPSRMIP